ncbi:hypothetical protein [Streptomyces mirabilis]|uniref:hypothetical protein n=1 Tax=Streptomyces mirabilis TaxID=68239 RepID=UPI0036597ACB
MRELLGQFVGLDLAQIRRGIGRAYELLRVDALGGAQVQAENGLVPDLRGDRAVAPVGEVVPPVVAAARLGDDLRLADLLDVVDDVEDVADGAALVGDGSVVDLLGLARLLGPIGRVLSFLGVLVGVLGCLFRFGRGGIGAIGRRAGVLGVLFGLGGGTGRTSPAWAAICRLERGWTTAGAGRSSGSSRRR